MSYKNPKDQSLYNTQWAKLHPKRVARAYKKWTTTRKGHACQMHHRKAAWCRKHKIKYELSRDWYLEHLNHGCELTEIAFQRGHTSYSASVDRFDPDQGYTIENSRMILFGLNALKGTGTDQDMLLIVTAFLNQQE